MPYYDSNIYDKSTDIMKYFQEGILNNAKNIGHCLLLWGPDVELQCNIAFEIARLLNCKKNSSIDCDCINCRWIRENTHPAVNIITRLNNDISEQESEDNEYNSGSKKNITVSQARAISNELAISSEYHRIFIFCDIDDDGNLAPLNKINFPEITSNALLKTFEEPPKNITFIFLTKDKTDVISTVVSRSQTFFVPSIINEEKGFNLVESFIENYWQLNRNQVLEFEDKLTELTSSNNPKTVFTQIQNYMLEIIKNNYSNKPLYYRLLEDIKYVEEAKKQISLTPAMQLGTVCENLSFKLLLK